MIKIYNRVTKDYEVEQVAGERYLNWTYSSPVGMSLLEAFIKKSFFSKAYGWYCDRNFSSKKISKFASEFNIDMSINEKKSNDFGSFNDFFSRKLVHDARPISKESGDFISPGDGRLLAYTNIALNNLIQVKGFTYSLYDLVQDSDTAEKYKDGICMVLRLCPTDYHRFHFIDSGTCSPAFKIQGNYYSVNPAALSKVKNLYCENKREWSIFSSDNFGDILYVEVGATCVGSIIQTYKPGERLNKGDEKGYFKFGGSTVIIFVEKDKIKIDDDIISQTQLGIETKVLMGEKIGSRI
ncbi:MAG: phosphatidylserine decarboxylase [Bacillota bacterium]|nr:phosphatidylserine decarboxylase [Bacillota bacterium]